MTHYFGPDRVAYFFILKREKSWIHIIPQNVNTILQEMKQKIYQIRIKKLIPKEWHTGADLGRMKDFRHLTDVCKMKYFIIINKNK